MRFVVLVFAPLPLLALLASSVGAQQPQLDLRLKFAKGDTHRMNVTIDQTVLQTVQGARQETRQTIGVVYTFSVDDVDAAGVATITVQYDSVSFHARTPNGPVDYDSSQPPGQIPSMASGLAALVGQGYSMKTSPNGKVVEVSGLDKLLAGVLGKLNVSEGPARTAAEKALREQINEQNMRSNLQNIFAPFPDKLVALGESWTRKNQISIGFPLVIETTYTLQNRQNGLALVDMTGASATAPDAIVDLGQMKMTYELHGSLHGSLQILESNGWTQSAQTMQTLTGSATIRVANAQPQTVPVTIQSTMKTEQK